MSFRAREIAAILIVGVIGVLIAGLQPQLLGALAAEGRLSPGGLGALATAELLAMGIAAGGAGFVLPIGQVRGTAAAALITTAAIDLATPLFGAAALFAARIAAGLGEGVLIWVAIGFIVRTARPERWSGIYLAAQTLGQFAVAGILSRFVTGSAGGDGGFALLGAVTLAGLPALPWLPRAYAALEGHGETGGAPPPRGLIALGGVVMFLAFVVAVWVYIEPLGRSRGLTPGAVAILVPLSLAMQVLGAGTAALIAGRLPPRRTIVVIILLDLAALAVMAAPPSGTAFVAAAAAFGFLWLFALPIQIPLVIAADPSRRAALLIGGAQFGGASLGPLAAGMLVGARGIDALPWFGAACAIAGLVALVAAARTGSLARAGTISGRNARSRQTPAFRHFSAIDENQD